MASVQPRPIVCDNSGRMTGFENMAIGRLRIEAALRRNDPPSAHRAPKRPDPLSRHVSKGVMRRSFPLHGGSLRRIRRTVVAAPHVGDSSFVAQLNGLFPQNRLQRFDFVDDPVTMLPPRGLPVLDYARAGTRVAYQDIMPPAPFAPERLPELEAKLYSAAMAPGHRGLGLKVLLVAEVLPDLCYHYPAWYMAAAYNQLAPHLKELMPSPLPLPMVGSHFPCGPGHIMRAKKRMVEANPVLFNPVTR